MKQVKYQELRVRVKKDGPSAEQFLKRVGDYARIESKNFALVPEIVLIQTRKPTRKP